jgi:hypothetical protein
MAETRTVQLPSELCATAEKKFGHKFASLEDFLIFVLQDLSRNDAFDADSAEQKLVEERLRELGYL